MYKGLKPFFHRLYMQLLVVVPLQYKIASGALQCNINAITFSYYDYATTIKDLN